MALATRPKPSVSHRKRQAQHHRHTKPYLKTYWPYLPMLAIIGLGYLANNYWPSAVQSGLLPNDLVDSNGQALTRIQTVSGSSGQTLLLIVLGITAAAFAVVLFRHWYKVQRLLNRGEKFAAEHVWLDVALVLVVVVGVVLTR